MHNKFFYLKVSIVLIVHLLKVVAIESSRSFFSSMSFGFENYEENQPKKQRQQAILLLSCLLYATPALTISRLQFNFYF